MKRMVIGAALVALGLSGCTKQADETSVGAAYHGRYIGVGIYPAGQMWSQMVVSNAPKDATPAKPNDDEQIIVVVDSQTGELRQCGNLTGYCVGMNPWAKPLAASQFAPIPLAKHAADLAREAQAAATKDTSAAKQR